MELGAPSSPSGFQRQASGELASAFSGLTTTSTQLGQGQASAGLAKRKPGQLSVQLGRLQPQQGRSLQENAQALPWAKRRCVSAEDLPSFQVRPRGTLHGFGPAPATARFPAPPTAPAFAPPAAVLPSLPVVQHPLHRYNLRSGSGTGSGGAAQHPAAGAGCGGPFQSAARRPAGAAPGADRGHLLSSASRGDCGHLLPAYGGGFHQPVLAGVQPVQVQHPAGFGLPPRYPGPAAGQPPAANPSTSRQQQPRWQQPQARRDAAGAPAALAAVGAAGAAAAAAGAVAAVASVSQGASSLAHMMQQPAAAQLLSTQPASAAQPGATWLGPARSQAPRSVPAAAPLAFPAYPAPAVMSAAAHVAFSDSQEDSLETHAFLAGSARESLDDDFYVLDDGSSSSGEDEDWESPAGQEGFHSAHSHPSVLRELPPEGGPCPGNQQQQQQQQGGFGSKDGSSPAAQAAAAAAAAVTAAAAAPAPQRKPSARELERLLQAELRAANEALCAVSFPEHITFCPVHEADCMIPLCVAYNIPPISIALGASYFQRLLARSTDMRRQARAEGFFVQVPIPGLGGKAAVMMRCPNTACDSLRLTYLSCIYLGAKVGDRVRYSSQLSSMMKAAVGYSVSSRQAAQLEGYVLESLKWRLGPYFDLSPDGGF